MSQLGDDVAAHPAVAATFKFCSKQLKSSAKRDEQAVLYVLNLLQAVLPHFSPEQTKLTIERVLLLLNKGSQTVFVGAMQVKEWCLHLTIRYTRFTDARLVRLTDTAWDFPGARGKTARRAVPADSRRSLRV
jgi:hypothetical protein